MRVSCWQKGRLREDPYPLEDAKSVVLMSSLSITSFGLRSLFIDSSWEQAQIVAVSHDKKSGCAFIQPVFRFVPLSFFFLQPSFLSQYTTQTVFYRVTLCCITSTLPLPTPFPQEQS